MLSDRSGDAPLLAVFDNFETVRNPADVYAWLSNAIRLPNKALITTRFHEFKADYPVEVGGMTEDEFRVLVDAPARQLGLAGSLFDAYAKELYEESDGHPYVAKILLGEAAIQGGRRKVKRVLAAKEDVLDALFVRTFELLPPRGPASLPHLVQLEVSHPPPRHRGGTHKALERPDRRHRGTGHSAAELSGPSVRVAAR